MDKLKLVVDREKQVFTAYTVDDDLEGIEKLLCSGKDDFFTTSELSLSTVLIKSRIKEFLQSNKKKFTIEIEKEES